MRDTITLVGTIGTVPALQTSDDGRPFLNFRLATNHSWQNKETHQFVEGEPNWFTVKAFRSLAVNVHASVAKGQRIIVTGRLSVRRWENGEKSGTQVEVMADHIGHDLALGTARYSRMSTPDTSRQSPADDGLDTTGGTVQDGAGRYGTGQIGTGQIGTGQSGFGPTGTGSESTASGGGAWDGVQHDGTGRDEGEAASSDAGTAESLPAGSAVTDLTGREVLDEPEEPANAPF